MLAIALNLFCRRDAAALRDIPRSTLVNSFRVDCVRGSLHVYANSPQSDEKEVSKEGYDRVENMHYKHCELGEIDEHAQDTDNEIVLGITEEG